MIYDIFYVFLFKKILVNMQNDYDIKKFTQTIIVE
jgi:hypothetical protein